MVAHKQQDPSAKIETPGIAKGLIDLVCVLARHAARELVVTSNMSPFHGENPDDRAED